MTEGLSSSGPEPSDKKISPEIEQALGAFRNDMDRYVAMCDFVQALRTILEQLNRINPGIPLLHSYQLYHSLLGSTMLEGEGQDVDLPNNVLYRYIHTQSLAEQQQVAEEILAQYRALLPDEPDADEIVESN